MTQPYYDGQIAERRGPPIVDIPEEEFDERLEEMMHYLDALESEEAVP